jgi:ABC-type bacteriocin/lantibiotic exporter with double-glycine peptidase domain
MIAAFVEIVSIGSIFPLMVALAPGSKTALSENQHFAALLNFFSPTGSLPHIEFALYFFIGFAIFAGALRSLLTWVQVRFSYALGAEFSAKIYKELLNKAYSYHLETNSSELISSITIKSEALVAHCIYPIISICSSTIIALIILAGLLALNPILAIATLIGLLAIYVAVTYCVKKLLVSDGNMVNSSAGRIQKHLQESFRGIREIILDGSQHEYIKSYKQILYPFKKASGNLLVVSLMPRYMIESLIMILIAVASFVLSGQESLAGALPEIGVLVIAIQKLLPISQQMYSAWTALIGGRASVEAAMFILEAKNEHMLEQSPIKIGDINFKDRLEIQGLNYRYGDQNEFIFNNISLEIFKGYKVGFIGQTGSGKTTLLDLVMGLLRPTSGVILVDGVSLSSANLKQWQKKISHVPQNIYIRDGTFAENVAQTDSLERVDFSRLAQAIALASLEEFVKELPEGYMTPLGEDGARLSGGQKQRLGIARALYKNAELLILDEATSALDIETEESVMQAIENLPSSLTILIVAHRYSTLRSCDLIYEIKDGSITWSGSYASLCSLEKTKISLKL